MELLLLLLIGHIVADFYIQKFDWIVCRNNHHFMSKGLLLHVFTHFIITLFVLHLAGYLTLFGVFIALIIVVSHYLIDVWKSYKDETLNFFFADQLLHLLVLFAVWLYVTSVYPADFAIGYLSANVLLWIVALLAVGRPVFFTCIIGLKEQLESITEANSGRARSLMENQYFGYAERIAVVTLIFQECYLGLIATLCGLLGIRLFELMKRREMGLAGYAGTQTAISFSVALAVGFGLAQYSVG